MTIFFTADHHFGHTNIIKYANRPFASVEEMDAALIEVWNSRVTDDDLVYHLGDFTLGGINKMLRYYQQLNGTIVIMQGNHDWRWIGEYREWEHGVIDMAPPLHTIEIDGHLVVMCHYAMRVWDRAHHGSFHIYGHSHGELPGVGRSMDIGVDTHPNYAPYTVGEVLDKLRPMQFMKHHEK